MKNYTFTWCRTHFTRQHNQKVLDITNPNLRREIPLAQVQYTGQAVVKIQQLEYVLVSRTG